MVVLCSCCPFALVVPFVKWYYFQLIPCSLIPVFRTRRPHVLVILWSICLLFIFSWGDMNSWLTISGGDMRGTDAGLMCPRPMCPRPKVLGCCTPWTKCPLDIMSLTDVSRPWTASRMDRIKQDPQQLSACPLGSDETDPTYPDIKLAHTHRPHHPYTASHMDDTMHGCRVREVGLN